MQHFRTPRNAPYNRLLLAGKPTSTHWYSFNNAVRLLNKAKSRLFRSIMNFKNFENHVDFVSQPASQPASRKTWLR